MSEFFETIKIDDAKIYNLEYHQQRYENTLKSLSITEFKSLASYIKVAEKGLLRCKVIYDAKGIKNVEYFKYTKRKINSLKLVYADAKYMYKSTNREILDTLFEQKQQCDDILIVQNNLITDTSIANIALYKEGIWYTPKRVLLKGTTRQRYLDASKLVLKDIKVEDLGSYTKVALLNAMIDFDIILLNKGDFFVK